MATVIEGKVKDGSGIFPSLRSGHVRTTALMVGRHAHVSSTSLSASNRLEWRPSTSKKTDPRARVSEKRGPLWPLSTSLFEAEEGRRTSKHSGRYGGGTILVSRGNDILGFQN